MAAIHDTAYPRLKYNLTQKEITRVYTPVDEEMTWLKKRRFKGDQSLTCLVYLKCFQRLGYFPKPSDIPVSLVNHIASFTRFDNDNYKRLPAVPKATHKRIEDAARRYCGVTAFSLRDQGTWIKAFADDIARTKENVIDIINAMLEIMVKESIELPAFSTLERIAYSSRARANATYFRKITQTLSPKTVDILATLLSTKTDSGITQWQVLKSEPKKPSVRALEDFTAYTAWVKQLYEHVGPLPEIPEEKRAQFILEARAYTSDRMKAMQSTKRKALLASLVNEQLYCCTDFLIDFFIREIRKIHNKARGDLNGMFELCVMTEVAKRFVSGDIFVQKSTRYDDYRQHLVS